MSWDNLASALHDALCDDLGCGENMFGITGDDVTLHGLSREWWHTTATSVEEYVKARVRDRLPPSILSSLRSHAFGNCSVCDAAVDEPEAIYICGSI